MRRASLVIAAVAAAALGLTACSGTPASQPAETTTTPVGSAPDLSIVEDGPLVESIEIVGDFGSAPSVSVQPNPSTESASAQLMERRIVTSGAGATLADSDVLVMQAAIYDLGTGAPANPYGPIGQGITLGNPQLPDYLRSLLAGATSGSRIAATVPANVLLGSSTGAQNVGAMLLILDVQAVAPGTAADGAPQPPSSIGVSVTGEPGAPPTVQVLPDAAATAPDAQHTGIVLAGTGDAVESGDYVTVQYTGLLAADGSIFDSSWQRGGTPSSFSTEKVVPGFANALIGQRVGSRIVTVFGSDLGYGDSGSSAIPGGAPLVFVVDILATM